MVSLLLAGCFLVKSDEDMIRDRLKDFSISVNSGDLEGVLKCFDAKTRNTYQAVLNVGDKLSDKAGFGLGFSNLWSLATTLQGVSLTFSDLEISVIGDEATVFGTMAYSQDGESGIREVSIPMVKEKGDWYVYITNDLDFD